MQTGITNMIIPTTINTFLVGWCLPILARDAVSCYVDTIATYSVYKIAAAINLNNKTMNQDTQADGQ